MQFSLCALITTVLPSLCLVSYSSTFLHLLDTTIVPHPPRAELTPPHSLKRDDHGAAAIVSSLVLFFLNVSPKVVE